MKSIQLVKRVPSGGRPLLAQWICRPYRMQVRVTENPNQLHVGLAVESNDRILYDVVGFEYLNERQRLARQLARLARSRSVAEAEEFVEAVYAMWRQMRRESYTAYPLGGTTDRGSPARFLLYPFFPIGAVTILAGDGGVGKSALSLLLTARWLHDSVDGVIAINDRSVPKHWLYFDWELTDPEIFRHRCYRMSEASDPMLEPIVDSGRFYHVHQNLFEFAETLFEEAQRYPSGLIVLDSLSAAVQGSLNDERIAREVMLLLSELARSGCAVLVIAHVAKEDARAKAKVGPFGSRMYYNLARQVIEIEASGDEYQFTITKNNYAPRSDSLIACSLDWTKPSARFFTKAR